MKTEEQLKVKFCNAPCARQSTCTDSVQFAKFRQSLGETISISVKDMSRKCGFFDQDYANAKSIPASHKERYDEHQYKVSRNYGKDGYAYGI